MIETRSASGRFTKAGMPEVISRLRITLVNQPG
jgi:hypothetical protein